MENNQIKILEQKFALAMNTFMKMEQGLEVIDRKGIDNTQWKVAYMKNLIEYFYEDLVRISEGKTKNPSI